MGFWAGEETGRRDEWVVGGSCVSGFNGGGWKMYGGFVGYSKVQLRIGVREGLLVGNGLRLNAAAVRSTRMNKRTTPEVEL